MSNIAEGFDRGTQAEFIDALFIGKGEVGEVRSQLYISFDRSYITQDALNHRLRLTDEYARLIQSFAAKVKGGAHRGIQFKYIPSPDPGKEILKQHNPEMYKKFYPDG